MNCERCHRVPGLPVLCATCQRALLEQEQALAPPSETGSTLPDWEEPPPPPSLDDQIWARLKARGLVSGERPKGDPIDLAPPIEVRGEPLSRMIIRERRG